MSMNEQVLLGMRDVWGHERPFTLSLGDRRHHVYVIGKSGTGKTTLLRNMILQDIEAGRGVGVIDPHGDLALDVLSTAPAGIQRAPPCVRPIGPGSGTGCPCSEAPGPRGRPSRCESTTPGATAIRFPDQSAGTPSARPAGRTSLFPLGSAPAVPSKTGPAEAAPTSA